MLFCGTNNKGNSGRISFFFIYFASSYVGLENYFYFNKFQPLAKHSWQQKESQRSNKFRLNRKHVCALLNRFQINKINLILGLLQRELKHEISCVLLLKFEVANRILARKKFKSYKPKQHRPIAH